MDFQIRFLLEIKKVSLGEVQSIFFIFVDTKQNWNKVLRFMVNTNPLDTISKVTYNINVAGLASDQANKRDAEGTKALAKRSICDGMKQRVFWLPE